MSRFSLNEDQESRSAILDFHRDCRKGLAEYKAGILDSMAGGNPAPPEFIGMTRDEVERHFDHLRRELELLISFRLMAAAEARFRVDFIFRVLERRKDEVSRKFRSIAKKKKSLQEIDLKEIVKVWRKERGDLKSSLDQFNNLLELRHWLAHGRYWAPKFGRIKTPEEVDIVVSELFTAIVH